MILHVEDAKLSMLVIFSWLCLHTCSHALESRFDHSTTLCSPMHKFCLKFAPLQIDPTHTWIANRNDPIDNSSGVLLTCNHSGALSITSQGRNPITILTYALPTKQMLLSHFWILGTSSLENMMLVDI